MNFYQTDKTYSRGDRVRFADGSVMRCTKPTSRNSKEDFRSDEMKLKDIVVTFYKQCKCEDVEDVTMVTLHGLAVSGGPECYRCGKEYLFDEEADLWDTF